MPKINEFLGPTPTKSQVEIAEKIIGNKPCFKCDKNSEEYYWDPKQYIMSWTCPDGHHNTVKVNS